MNKMLDLWYNSGLYQMSFGQAVMILVGLLLLYLAIKRNFEPLLLIPIGFGGILVWPLLGHGPASILLVVGVGASV